MKRNMNLLKVLLFIFAGVIFLQVDSLAHSMKIFATVEGEQIKGYCYISGGGKAENVKVEIKDIDGKVLESASTGKEGEFVFKPSLKGEYTLFADSGDGHAANYKISTAVPDSSDANAVMTENGDDPNDKTTDTDAEVSEDGDTVPASYTVSSEDIVGIDDIRKVVAEEVARQVAPLTQKIEMYQNRIQFSDIIAGIGYILGIAGITFYLLATRNKQQ